MFPPGSIRAAVAAMGDDWKTAIDHRAYAGPAIDAETMRFCHDVFRYRVVPSKQRQVYMSIRGMDDPGIRHVIRGVFVPAFPEGSIRSAVHDHGDAWLSQMPVAVQNSVDALAEFDGFVMRSDAWRRSVLRREIGYQAELPANVREAL